jgi:N-acetylglutamate synthase-like GNAT family acetyltransferase
LGGGGDIDQFGEEERLNRDKPPLCLVAFVENQPVATAALKIREMETHPQYEHWLGNVYVLPEFRAQGIGSTVIERAKQETKRIGIRDLYLYTRDRAHLYARLGWATIEQVTYRGQRATIMWQGLL